MKKKTTLTQDVKIKNLPQGANVLVVMNQNASESGAQDVEGQLKFIFSSVIKKGNDWWKIMTLCRQMTIAGALEIAGSGTGAAELLGIARTHVSTLSCAGLTSSKTWKPTVQDSQERGVHHDKNSP